MFSCALGSTAQGFNQLLMPSKPERIQFTEGVVQLEGASLNAPYDLKNGEIDYQGRVQALNSAGLYSDAFPGGATKPFVRDPGDGDWITGMDDYAYSRGTLYLSDVPSKKTEVLKPGSNGVTEEAPARINYIGPFKTPNGPALSAFKYCTYLFIPYNGRGEAGPWVAKKVGGYWHRKNFKFNLYISDNTEWVDVYRTPEYGNSSGNKSYVSAFFYLDRFSGSEKQTNDEKIARAGVNNNTRFNEFTNSWDYPQNTDTVYLADTHLYEDIDPNKDYTIEFNRTFVDGAGIEAGKKYNVIEAFNSNDTAWDFRTGIQMDVTYDGEALERGNRERSFATIREKSSDAAITERIATVTDDGTKLFREGKSTTRNEEGDFTKLPAGKRMNESRNLHSQTNTSLIATKETEYQNLTTSSQYKGFAANSFHYSGGVLYYGGVHWPTKEPFVYYYRQTASFGNTTYEMKLQLRYQTKDGIVFGPVAYLPNAFNVSVMYQGELGVDVYLYYSGVGWVFVGTRKPNKFGNYGKYVFSSSRWTEDYKEEGTPNPVTEYIHEENTVFLSATYRPWEALYTRNFSIDKDETIRAMFKSRLKEDDQKAYDFYIATDKAVYVASPDLTNDDIRTSVIDQNVGIKEKSLHVPVPKGVVFVGTDDRLYYMTGRQMEPLVIDEINMWQTINDITYDIDEREVVIATDNGLWFYDLDRKGWTKQYDENADLVFWDEQNKLLVFRVSGTMYQMDGSGSQRTAKVITQKLANITNRTGVESVEIDYEKTGYDVNDNTTWATIQHAIRHPSVLQVDEDPSAFPDKINATLEAPSNRPRYMRLDGRGHQFSISDFDTLREVKINISNKDDTNTS